MPHENHWDHDSLYRKFSGVITGEEILESNFKLQADPNFENIKFIINDFLEVTGHEIEFLHIDIYATTDNIASNTKGRLKIALVVPDNTSLVDIAKNYRELMLSSLFSCEIFNTVEDAKKWAIDQ